MKNIIEYIKYPLVLLLLGVPKLFWYIQGDFINQGDKPVLINELTPDILEKMEGKFVSFGDFCLGDYTLYSEEGTNTEELIPVISCDSTVKDSIYLFVLVKSGLFKSMDKTWELIEKGKFDISEGKLSKGISMDYKAVNLLKRSDLLMDIERAWELQAGKKPEDVILIWKILKWILPFVSLLTIIYFVFQDIRLYRKNKYERIFKGKNSNTA